jgi:demethylmenaquinone methyltransferase / 2-methoxy-6-polyprenyl-1,4-benzoquinol methylase
MKGTTPPGAHSEEQAAAWVRSMFSRIAGRYDFANHLLSFNIDRSWRRRTVIRVGEVLARPEARVLDLCCGTGDLALALSDSRSGSIYASDFCHPMLRAAQTKVARKAKPVRLFEADALHLPIADSSFDLITCAFGFRNLANYDAGLREIRRVLRPGGILAVLEFSHPPQPALASLYSFYSRRILPKIGQLLSGTSDAYTYLPESVGKFPGVEELAANMRAIGFRNVQFERLTFGVVALHTGSV